MAREQAIQAVVAHVVGVHRQAAYQIDLLEVAEAAGNTHRRIIQQYITDTLRLLVFDQQFCVVGEIVRGFQTILLAKDPQRTAFGHLATGVRFTKTFLGGVGTALYFYGFKHMALFLGCMGKRGGETGECQCGQAIGKGRHGNPVVTTEGAFG